MAAPSNTMPPAFDGAAIHASRSARADYIAALDPNNVTNLFAWKESPTAGNSDFLVSRSYGDTVSPSWICAIGRILPDRPYLKARGNWSPNYSKPLQDAKLQFSLGSAASVSGHLGADFDKAVNVIKVLQHNGGTTANHRFFVGEYRQRPTMRLSFPLFSARTTEFDPNNLNDTTVNYPIGDDLKDLLRTAASTHSINPLPFYNEFGHPMRPNFLEHHLMGAVVEVWFSFHHYAMGPQGKPPTSDTFVGRVEQLRVLARGAGAAIPTATTGAATRTGGMYVPTAPATYPLTAVGNASGVQSVLPIGPPLPPSAAGSSSGLVNIGQSSTALVNNGASATVDQSSTAQVNVGESSGSTDPAINNPAVRLDLGTATLTLASPAHTVAPIPVAATPTLPPASPQAIQGPHPSLFGSGTVIPNVAVDPQSSQPAAVMQ
ncbi:hypothetical protein MD484_g8324, partial [Candolleomyces efflorescens]